MSESNKNNPVIGQKTDAALHRLEYIEQLATSLLARVELERSGIDPDDDHAIGTVDIDLHALEIFLAAARNFDADPTERLLAWLRESYPGCDATDMSQIPAWILPALRQRFVEDVDFDETMLRDCLMRAVRQRPREFYHYCVTTEPEENLRENSWPSFDLTDPNESEDLISIRIPINMPMHQAVGAIERALDWVKKDIKRGGGGDLKFCDLPPF
jgi:hypothetical protein